MGILYLKLSSANWSSEIADDNLGYYRSLYVPAVLADVPGHACPCPAAWDALQGLRIVVTEFVVLHVVHDERGEVGSSA